MIRPILATLRWIFEIFLRRRRLLLLPIVVSIPLSIIGALIVPTTYVSRALLLLQESASDNLAPRETSFYGDTTRERIAGLQALLKSDHILIPVLESMADGQTPIDSRRLEIEVDSLRNRLSLELIGNDFLRFQLRGTSPKGLKPILEAVISRFLGSLIAPEETVLSATQLVKDHSAKELDAAEKRLAEAERRLAELPLPNASNGPTLDTLERQVAAKTKDAQKARDAVDKARAGLKENPPGFEDINQQIEALTKLTSGNGPTEGQSPEVTQGKKERLQGLMLLRDAYRAREQAEGALQQGIRAVTALERAKSERTDAEELVAHLKLQHDEAKRLYEMYMLRFSAPLARLPLHILKMPDQIRIIDPPKEPDFPLVSRRYIAAAGSLVGVLFAIAFVIAAELLDARIWRLELFKIITGLPVLAELPAAALMADGTLGAPALLTTDNCRQATAPDAKHLTARKRSWWNH